MGILYVSQKATGNRNGASWANAYTDLIAAIANANDGDELWIAQGTYVPGTTREATFKITHEVALYGGFDGTELTRGDRNWQSNLTVFSGDIGTPQDNRDNSHHVVTADSTAGAILDGIIIEAGNTQGAATDDGGGLYNRKKLTLENVVVRNNQSADDGGGLRNDGTLTLINSTVANNTSIGKSSTSGGGGLLNTVGAKATIINSTFSGNQAQNGGAIRNDAQLRLINTTLSGNTATSVAGGGGGLSNSLGEVSIINSTITQNSAAGVGGGVITTNTVTVTNSIIAANQNNSDVAAISFLPFSGSFTSNGHNLIGNGDGVSGFVHRSNGDQVGTTANPIAPMLSALRNNGGFTQTHAPSSNSLVINAGNNRNVAADTADLDGDRNTTETIPIDPTGKSRILDTTVDIGAVESAAVTPVDSTPTIELTPVLAALAEDANTTNRIKVADIGVRNAGLGSASFSLKGTDASVFEVEGSDLFLKSGTVLDFETKPQYEITVQIGDTDSDTASNIEPEALRNFGLTVQDINEAPTTLLLQNSVVSLADTTDTTERLKLADIAITDDALGSNTLRVVDQPALKQTTTQLFEQLDAESFEIVGTQLFLKAGTILDVERQAQYNITIQVDDTAVGNSPDAIADFSLAITDIEALRLQVAPQQQLTLAGETGHSQLSLSLAQINTRQVDEIIVAVADKQGRINGIAPDSAGYLEAFINQSEVVFSILNTGDFDLKASRAVDISSDTRLQFAVIEGGSLDSLRQGSSGTLRMVTASAEGDNVSSSALRIEQLSDRSLQLGFDLNGSGDFQDIVLNALLEDAIAPIGTAVQGGGESELFDLREIVGTVTATFEVYREADFDNQVGFFAIEDVTGQVLDAQGALLGIGDDGYVLAAMQRRIAVNLTAQNSRISTYSAEIAGGQLLSSFIISDGSVELLLDGNTKNDPSVFFTHIGANSDRADHVRLLGDNIFGFEDMAGGGDQDFNDIVVKTRFV